MSLTLSALSLGSDCTLERNFERYQLTGQIADYSGTTNKITVVGRPYNPYASVTLRIGDSGDFVANGSELTLDWTEISGVNYCTLNVRVALSGTNQRIYQILIKQIT